MDSKIELQTIYNPEDLLWGKYEIRPFPMELNMEIADRIQVSENEKQNTVQYGDVLFTESSETPDECGMSSVVTTPSNEKLYVNSFCFGYRFSNKELILSVYSGSPGEEFCKKNGLKHRVI